MGNALYGVQRCPMEWGIATAREYADPFNDLDLDVLIVDAADRTWRVPAFWAGGNEWRVRFSAPAPGQYRYRSVCTDPTNCDLHGREGTLVVREYDGANPLLKHGPLGVSENRRYLEHKEGTPFYWLGDTWWMGLCRRLKWPEGFQTLAADRCAKGFSVIQIVAGMLPDMGPFEERGKNEAGWPWEPGFTRINPGYFDMADLRIHWLVRSGLVPCIFGCWGYYIHWLGVEKMKKHWRNLIARYGCYPVVWCLAGEATMPFYESKQREKDAEIQKEAWTQIAHYVHEIDPYGHPLTVHPSRSARECVSDVKVLDLDMLQTGHNCWHSVPNTIRVVGHAYEQHPVLPVINGEVTYEGHQQTNWADIQRFMFWTNMLCGAKGFTYGAGGIWQMNALEEQQGPRKHSGAFENTPWEEAMNLPGSRQIGLGAALLQRYPWHQFEPHDEWVEPRWNDENYKLPYAAGIPGVVRVIYIPPRIYRWTGPCVKQLEPEMSYHAFYFSPVDGTEYDLGAVTADKDNSWQSPIVPFAHDWVLVLERDEPAQA